MLKPRSIAVLAAVGALMLSGCTPAGDGSETRTPTAVATTPAAPSTADASPAAAGDAAANAELVRDFYEQVFVERDVRAAADAYIGDPYVQHNPFVGDGADAFVKGITAVLEGAPERTVEIHRVLAQGDLVLLHSEMHDKPGDTGKAVLDIFKVAYGKIVEHWDAVQDVPAESANGHTMFDGPTDPGQADEDTLAANTKTVLDFARISFNEGNPQKAVDEYVGDEYIQHNPEVPDGTKEFVAFFTLDEPAEGDAVTKFPRTIAQGDLVAVQMFTPATDSGSIDIFRLEGGKIVEHWDVVQQYPTETASGNTVWDDGE